MQKESPILRNAKEIGRYIGFAERMVPELKKSHNLPIWRFTNSGSWRALKPSLDKWMEQMEKKYLL